MRTVLSAGLTVCCALAIAAPAAARSIPVDLRVEGADGRSLTADRYQTFHTSVRTARRPPDCNGSGARKRVPGVTALGTLIDGALVNSKLDPLLVSDEFDFGLMVCGIGGDNAGGSSSFWLYKVNHVAPEVGADQFPVKRGDQVLWYFVEGSRNSGDELELVAPARVQPGEEFEASVIAYNSQGVRRPVAGATVAGGGESATTDASGVARLPLDRSGNRTLRATLDPHIPSAPTKVCVNENLPECAPARGTRIWGSRRSDPIAGTAGPDRIRAGRGDDRIRVRRGSRDRVACGAGRDRVLAGTQDRIAGDCEVVRYRGRR
jgi:hypothetical protein